jgi:uncharacterized protein YjdB
MCCERHLGHRESLCALLQKPFNEFIIKFIVPPPSLNGRGFLSGTNIRLSWEGLLHLPFEQSGFVVFQNLVAQEVGTVTSRPAVFLSLFVVATVLSLSGCGGGSSAAPDPPALTSIKVLPSTQTLDSVGETTQFKATGTYANKTTEDITAKVTWQSSATSIATMGNTRGLATAVASGKTTIMASMAGVTGTAVLSVGIPHLVSISITPSTQTLSAVGETTQFKAIGTYSPQATEDITTQAKWQSSDTSVATMGNTPGLATAVSGGKTTVMASTDGVIGSAALTVKADAAGGSLTSLTVIPASQIVHTVGETTQFIAIGTFNGTPTTQDVTDQVTWQSSDVQIGTIDSSGLAVGLSAGTTTITAEFTSPTGNVTAANATFTETADGGDMALPVLGVYKVGAGDVTVVSSPASIDCGSGSECSGSFTLDTIVTLSATAKSGSEFGGWSSNCQVLTANSCKVIMKNNETVGAIFNKIQ